jgi:hypothetical protein
MSWNRKAVGVVAALASAGLFLAACGGSGDRTTTRQLPAVAPSTAGQLAKLSDRVASDLDAGDTCHAAHAADDLKSAVEEADLPATMRTSVDTVAGQLVDQVNCPPPPLTDEERKKLEEEQKKLEEQQKHESDHHGGDHGPKPPGHGGKLPPGQAKLKGEPG